MIWVPDTFMKNSKEEFKHVVTVPNRFFRVYLDGIIFYSQRYIAEGVIVNISVKIVSPGKVIRPDKDIHFDRIIIDHKP